MWHILTWIHGFFLGPCSLLFIGDSPSEEIFLRISSRRWSRARGVYPSREFRSCSAHFSSIYWLRMHISADGWSGRVEHPFEADHWSFSWNTATCHRNPILRNSQTWPVPLVRTGPIGGPASVFLAGPILNDEQQNFIIRSMKNNPNFRAFVDGRSELSHEAMKDIAPQPES